jgi:serine/threonine protein phosphatase PrpC
MSPATLFPVSSAAATHSGKVRKHNEDACLDRPDIGLWVVADGMGGHQSGDWASKMIVDSLQAMGPPNDGAEFIAEVRTRLAAVNDELRDEASRRGGGTVIGSTVVTLMTFGAFYAALWAGDSRIYLLRDGALVQITRDHSQVQEMVDAGLLAADQAEGHAFANVITRAVGSGDTLDLDKVSDRLTPHDRFLLCSDGITKMLSDAEIAAILSGTPLAEVPAALIDAALAQGGKDNATAVAIEIGALPDQPVVPDEAGHG